MEKKKVTIKTFAGEVIWGYVYLNRDARLQDLVNDKRKFIPLERIHMDRGKGDIVYTSTMMVNKDTISTIEERLDK